MVSKFYFMTTFLLNKTHTLNKNLKILISTYLHILSFIGRVGFGLNPLEGESEPEELEDTLMGNTTSTFFPANQTATTSFQQVKAAKKSFMRLLCKLSILSNP